MWNGNYSSTQTSDLGEVGDVNDSRTPVHNVQSYIPRSQPSGLGGANQRFHSYARPSASQRNPPPRSVQGLTRFLREFSNPPTSSRVQVPYTGEEFQEEELEFEDEDGKYEEGNTLPSLASFDHDEDDEDSEIVLGDGSAVYQEVVESVEDEEQVPYDTWKRTIWGGNGEAGTRDAENPPAGTRVAGTQESVTRAAGNRAAKKPARKARVSTEEENDAGNDTQGQTQGREARYAQIRKEVLGDLVDPPPLSSLPDPRLIEGDADPRLAYDDHPRREGEDDEAHKKRVLGAMAKLGIHHKLIAGEKFDMRNRKSPAGAKRAWVNTAENRHTVWTNPLHDDYDEEYANRIKDVKRKRQERNRAVEQGLLERTREWQAKNGYDREPTPSDAEDSGDGLYQNEFLTNTARDAGRVMCLACHRNKKTCSLEKDSKTPCTYCTEKGCKCFRMMQGVRYRGAPYAAGNLKPDEWKDPVTGEERPYGEYMWKTKGLMKRGVKDRQPQEGDESSDDEAPKAPPKERKPPKPRPSKRGAYDTPSARKRAAEEGVDYPVPPKSAAKKRGKSSKATTSGNVQPASNDPRRFRQRSPEMDRHGLRTNIWDGADNGDEENVDRLLEQRRHRQEREAQRARSASPRRGRTPPPVEVYPDNNEVMNSIEDPGLDCYNQAQSGQEYHTAHHKKMIMS
jgi:hypothetical protein